MESNEVTFGRCANIYEVVGEGDVYSVYTWFYVQNSSKMQMKRLKTPCMIGF